MKIKPKNKRGKKFEGLHCVRCGMIVPFEAKWLTQFFQTKIKGVKRWIVQIGFVCPDCLTVTSTVLNYSHSQDGAIKRINLYGLYNKSK